MREYLVVLEPHADDAFISLGGHIEKWVKEGKNVIICTVCPQSDKRIGEAGQYAKAVGADYLPFGPGLDKLVKGRNVQCLIPVGIQHPEHIAVAEEYSKKCRNAWRYLDQPYALRLKNAEEVTDGIGGASIISYLKPPARKWRHIPIFKTQAKFFYFEEAHCRNSFELIVKIGRGK